jgi:branched-chain amino acid transport system ATP-binding protein
LDLLRVEALTISYGPIRAVRSVDLRVEAGEVVTVLGANGAGKSTLLKGIMGLHPVEEGHVMLRERDVTHHRPEDLVRQGMTLTPEGRHVFAGLTVDENLRLGAVGQAARTSRNGPGTQADVMELFPVLRERKAQTAGTLSGGEQQQLAIARSLMSNPQLLLLDEPSLGLAPRMVDLMFELIEGLRTRGTTILLIEQNTERALQVADRGYVLASGEVVLSGAAADLLTAPEVRGAYLGAAVT